MDFVPPPKRAANAWAAAVSRVSDCHAAPYGLTGSGSRVMLRDAGKVYPHNDLAGRVVRAADVASIQDAYASPHATHVAGTVAGSGAGHAGAKGMAPGCVVVNYDYRGDDIVEPAEGWLTHGCRISNHSYGFAVGWADGVWFDNVSRFGSYTAFTRDWDDLVRRYGLIFVKSAGNDRADVGDGTHPPDGTRFPDGICYVNLDDSATGKNVITVGSVSDSASVYAPLSDVASSFSSAGPCRDGRVKPDIVANGETLLTTEKSSSSYYYSTGTSIAAPVVAGAMAIIQQRARAVRGEELGGEVAKALLLNTAVDMGRPGPDPLHGFGLLDALAAVQAVDADVPPGRRLVSGSLSSTGRPKAYVLSSDGTPISATVCWFDQPGDPLAARAIINDLDIRIIRISTGEEFLPFVLDPSDPTEPAAAGVNGVDTVEQVRIAAPAAGEEYLVEVGASSLSTAQSFGLASSHDLVPDEAPVASFTASASAGHLPLTVNFDASASYDPDGTIIGYAWDFGDGMQASGATASHTYMREGRFTVRLTVTDDKRASSRAWVTIDAVNDAPVPVLSASPERGEPPLAVSLDASGSYDPDGTIQAIHWSLGDGQYSNDASLVHIYSEPDVYDVRLTVTDNFGKSAATTVRIVAGKPLTPYAAKFKLNFRKPDRDRWKLAAEEIEYPPGIVLDGARGRAIVSGIEMPFVLDERGRYRDEWFSIRLRPERFALKFRYRRMNLQDDFELLGARNEDIAAAPVSVFAGVVLDGKACFASDAIFLYTARAGRSGKGRL
ncbi:MAG: PKD domain-containing protein [Planctomycetota bacterium]|nr:PKD domain-containing protein [Planctomycetota bacterium]